MQFKSILFYFYCVSKIQLKLDMAQICSLNRLAYCDSWKMRAPKIFVDFFCFMLLAGHYTNICMDFTQSSVYWIINICGKWNKTQFVSLWILRYNENGAVSNEVIWKSMKFHGNKATNCCCLQSERRGPSKLLFKSRRHTQVYPNCFFILSKSKWKKNNNKNTYELTESQEK